MTDSFNNASSDNDAEESKSKSQRKREASAAQKLGERLITVSDKILQQLQLPENLCSAIVSARAIKSYSAKKRQLQYIGKLMRDIELTPVIEYFDALDSSHYTQTRQFKQIEAWRDRLLVDSTALTEFLTEFPSGESQALGQLIRNANNPKNPALAHKAKRQLFQQIKQIIEIRD